MCDGKWLLLIHQIPTKPAYFRVKIWRRLQSLGAVAIKNSVYIISSNDETLEDFQWVLREIVQGGGEASICAANFVEGLTDEQIEAMFQAARDSDYAQITEEARSRWWIRCRRPRQRLPTKTKHALKQISIV